MATTIYFATGKTAYTLTIQGDAEQNFQNLENAQQAIAALNELRELSTNRKMLEGAIAQLSDILEELEDDAPLVIMMNAQVKSLEEIIAKYGFSNEDNIDISTVPVRYGPK